METQDEPDWLEWERELEEARDDEAIARLTRANDAWDVPLLRPGRDERALRVVLRVGRRLRKLLGLR